MTPLDDDPVPSDTNSIYLSASFAGMEAPYYSSITTAWAALSTGKTLYMYSGTYAIVPDSVHGALNLTKMNNIGIVGVGDSVRIFGSGRGTFIELDSCQNIRITNIQFDGDRPAVYFPAIYAMICYTNACSNVWIEDCRFTNYGDHGCGDMGLVRTNNKNIWVTNCYFYNGGNVPRTDGSAVCINGSGYHVNFNTIQACYRGIEIEGAGSDTMHANEIIGNNIKTMTPNGGHGICSFNTPHHSYQFVDFTISNNQISGGSGSNAGIYVDGGENYLISNNTVDGWTGVGISVDATQASLLHCSLLGNILDSITTRGIQLAAVITPYIATGNLISNNQVTYAGNSGILVDLTSLGCRSNTVSNNVCSDNSSVSGQVGAGIEVEGSANTYTSITYNTCFDDQTKQTQDYGILVRASVDSLIMIGNICYSNRVAAVDDSSSEELDDDPLPVQMTSFSATPSSGEISLQWKTATEVDNYGFDIQRKPLADAAGADSPAWVDLGFVHGSGTSNSGHSYSYVDKNCPPGEYQYRLKQINAGGGFVYSASVTVTAGEFPETLSMAQNFPNPFNPKTTIGFTVPVSGRTVLKVYNIIGQRVAVLFDDIAGKGTAYQVSFDGSKLPSGMYFAVLEFGSLRVQKMMSLVK